MAGLRLSGIRACVFDAYGTLFDVDSAAARAKSSLGEQWKLLSEIWRYKQLQYTWLRALMGRHADFLRVTGDALDYAMESLNLDDPALRQRFMESYLALNTYPEVEGTLGRLKDAGMRLAILSNGTPEMLAAAVDNSGIGDLLNAILSVEATHVFKPHPLVYRLPVERFGLAPGEMCFVSSNAWDAYAAKAFGYRVLWCNRLGQPAEHIPEAPDGQVQNLAAIPEIVSL